jgi:multidrug efflux pump
VVPLAISSGAGSASRHSIGTGVIGGMLVATFVATLFIPMFYSIIARRPPKRPEDEDDAIEQTPSAHDAPNGSGGGL